MCKDIFSDILEEARAKGNTITAYTTQGHHFYGKPVEITDEKVVLEKASTGRSAADKTVQSTFARKDVCGVTTPK